MISVHEGGVCHLFPPSTPIFFSTLQRLHQQHWRRHLDRDQVASKELKMYGSPWSAPAWMKSNNALNGQVILFSLNGQVIAFSIIELLSDTIMDLTYVSNRVTFFQSITNNGLTIMSSEKRSLTPIYSCPCDHCHHCIYSDYHLIEQQHNANWWMAHIVQIYVIKAVCKWPL